MRILTNILLFGSLILWAACSQPQVPANSTAMGRMPDIFPDYTEVTIPKNLCPINFLVCEAGEEVVARITAATTSYCYGKGKEVIIDDSEWKQLLESAKGSSISIEIYVKNGGEWQSFLPFKVYVANEAIDSYISYRLIPPSYVSYEQLIIEQRDLTSFETREIFNNMKAISKDEGQCINCHSYQNYRTDNMLFHVRKNLGGTVIVNDGKLSKVNLKTPETISAGVYPAWHPTDKLIAFSTNKTAQHFYPKKTAKVEVFDTASDLILYDVESNTVSTISANENELECFPTWSPDGQWLYFTSARNGSNRYDLCRKSFDRTTHQFGATEIVYEASTDTLSVALPRISPDGHWLACAIAPQGCFHVWTPEADILVLDINHPGNERTSATTTLLNSNYSDSYPTFSSNGRWLMIDSRRDDGNYTRPYITYFDENGVCRKPFEVPQKSPLFYKMTFNSFNRPEFMVEPVKQSVNDFADIVKGDAIQAEYKKTN